MSARYFLDTNIFIYCFDESQPEKMGRAMDLVAGALQNGNGIISTQVIQEFLNASSRKFKVPLKPEDRKLFLNKVLYPLCRVFPDLSLYQDALDLMEQTHYSFYDSLILAGALQGGCTLLYSEDFQAGHQVGLLTIANPFKE